MSFTEERLEIFGELLDGVQFPPDDLAEAARAAVDEDTVGFDHTPLDNYGHDAQARAAAARGFVGLLGLDPSFRAAGWVAEGLDAIGHQPEDDPGLVVGLLRHYIEWRRTAVPAEDADTVVVHTLPLDLLADAEV